MDSKGRIKNESQVSVPRLHGRSKSGLVSTMTTMLKSQSTCTMHLTSVTTVGVYLKQVLKIASPPSYGVDTTVSVGIFTPCTHAQVGVK